MLGSYSTGTFSNIFRHETASECALSQSNDINVGLWPSPQLPQARTHAYKLLTVILGIITLGITICYIALHLAYHTMLQQTRSHRNLSVPYSPIQLGSLYNINMTQLRSESRAGIAW